jgi:hypothetical protein
MARRFTHDHFGFHGLKLVNLVGQGGDYGMADVSAHQGHRLTHGRQTKVGEGRFGKVIETDGWNVIWDTVIDNVIIVQDWIQKK